MIAYLEGRLLAVSDRKALVLTAGGVGYEVAVTGPVLAGLIGRTGENTALYVRTVVREDALDLFGFGSLEEKELFDILLSISKLGPKTALAILGHFTPEQLMAIALGDEPALLAKVPGIGKKSAEHIFLELKYKLKGARTLTGTTLPGPGVSVVADAMAGLVNLGYSEDEVRPVLERVWRDEPDLDVPALLRQTLKTLAKGRT